MTNSGRGRGLGVTVCRPSRTHWLKHLLVGSAFLGIAVYGYFVGFSSSSLTLVAGSSRAAYICGFFAVVGGLIVLFSAVVLIPGAYFARLAPEGLTIKTPLRTTSYEWSEIGRVGSEVTRHYSDEPAQNFSTEVLTFRSERTGRKERLFPSLFGLSAADLRRYKLMSERT